MGFPGWKPLLAGVVGWSVWLTGPSLLEPRLALAILAFVALLWILEAWHVSFTALLVPAFASGSGLLTVREALSSFAHPILFLFLGGFALAAALRQQQLDRRMAMAMLRLARGRLLYASGLLFVTTAATSMWISNTATAAMMLPIALGLLQRADAVEDRRLGAFLLLGMAYSANIGGIGTLVGSPPNAIAAAMTGLDFAGWLRIGLPAVLAMLPLMLALLWLVFRPDLGRQIEPEEELPPWNRQQVLTLLVFAVAVLGWLLGRPLGQWLGIERDFDVWVAMMALLALGALRLLSWPQLQRSVDWGVLILFGGGLTLSLMLQQSGASAWLAESLSRQLGSMPLWLFLLLLAGFVVMLTEFASNTASSALLIPLFLPLAPSLGLSDGLLAAVIAVAASCAFMLPVATPPNAIVYGSGRVPQRQMLRAGLLLNLVMAALIAFTALWLAA